MRVFTMQPWLAALFFFSGFIALRLPLLQDLPHRQAWSKSSCRLAFPLAVVASRQDYGDLGCNRSISRDAVRLGGLLYAYGISTHAHARIQFEPVPPTMRAGHFTGLVGLSDHVVYVGGSVDASIRVNGIERWRSRRLVAGVVESFRVPVESGSSIELVVGDAGDGIRSDEVAWARLQIK
jgi:hypothetical protein